MSMLIVRADGIYTPQGYRDCLSLMVEDGTIAALLCEPLIPLAAKDHLVRDFPGCRIAPAFCDRHLHFFHGADAKGNAASLLHHGIMDVYEAGDSKGAGLQVRKELADVLRIKACGFALFPKGGYGAYLGKAVESLEDTYACIDSLSCQESADYVKLIASGIFMPETGTVSPGGFPAQELKKIVRYCFERGLPVHCHANGDGQIRNAVLAGATAIVHGFFIEEDTMKLMADQGALLIPTIAALASLSKIVKTAGGRVKVKDAVARHMEAVGRCASLGVAVAAGSDSGPSFIPYGTAFIEELRFLRNSGLSSEQVVACASAGAIEEGQQADFTVLREWEAVAVFLSGVETIKDKR